MFILVPRCTFGLNDSLKNVRTRKGQARGLVPDEEQTDQENIFLHSKRVLNRGHCLRKSLWIVAWMVLFYIFEQIPSVTGRLDSFPRERVAGNLNNPCIRASCPPRLLPSWPFEFIRRKLSRMGNQRSIRLQIFGVAALRSAADWSPRNGWISLVPTCHKRISRMNSKKQGRFA